MSRVIKFRAWGTRVQRMYFNIEAKSNFVDYLDDSSFRVMQFTGLHDKNGKEIYEGDILQYDFLPEGSDQRSEVIFKNGKFCIEDGNNYMPSGEVIGNIYQNPELLK